MFKRLWPVKQQPPRAKFEIVVTALCRDGQTRTAEFQSSDRLQHCLALSPGLGMDTIDDVWLRSPDGLQMGYFQEISVRSGVCRVGHFAVEVDLQGKGLARPFAQRFFREIQQRHGIDQLLFAERSTKYFSANYPRFFNSLGAVAQPLPASQTRTDWLWNIANCP